MKRIIVCADGTWNERDKVDKETKKRRPTNVVKVARAVRSRAKNGIDQVVYYHDGVGTGTGIRDKITGGAFGHGIEDNIRELYRFILYNYADGDELFLFGFSRGAFTVRTLVGFMNLVGLVEKDDDYYIPEIYGCYEHGQRKGSPEWEKAFRKVQDTRACPRIRFIGVWDTVGALGAPGFWGRFNKGKYEYHDIGLNPHVDNAFHALAIDERRGPFAPSMWKRDKGFSGKLEQAWFAGVHSNVGGSSTPDGLANEALHWIVEKAEALGLEFDNLFLEEFTPCFNSTLHDSMSTMYKMIGAHVRAIGRQAADGEAVHQSAMDRLNYPPCKYAPANLKAYLASGGTAQTYDTTRIPRGTPCADLPKNP